ncbi:MAG: ATP-binding protein [Thermoanaerobacterales bacterium]|nr:ATP-binding protein [Bacillota bacterium]MDI6906688.1 ATP-binding protein [Thermoanaerobacterales bacterium]
MRRPFFGHSLRFQIIALVTLISIAPLVLVCYDLLFASKSERILLNDKEARLVSIVNFLHHQVAQEIEGHHPTGARERDRMLQEGFERAAGTLAKDYPGVRLGLYMVDSNQIFIKGFLHEYREFTPAEQKQREERVKREVFGGIQKVLDTREAVSRVGRTWDDQFLERLVPLDIGGKTVAVLWAEERMHPIFAQSQNFRVITRYAVLATILITATGALFIIINLTNRLMQIKNGVLQLENDIQAFLPDMPGELGQITRAVNKMAQGLAEKEALLEQLRRSDCLTALGRLVTGIAHELRNPLGILKATVQVMEEDYAEDKDIQDFVRRLNQQIDRQNSIVNELLDFGRPSKGAMEPQSVNTLIEKVLRFTAPFLRQRKVEVELSLDPDQPAINGDAEKLKQVFVNVILNAVQAMPDGGRLRIETSHSREWVKAVFEDTGQGVPPDVLPHIFEPYVTTREQEGGHGLGLAISHQIIGVHGGRMKAESEVGKGTRIFIYLPARGGDAGDAA